MIRTVNEYITANLTHQIHTSERRSYRGCRRRWNWVFREMYYPTITARPLEFGVAFHKAMETFYDPANHPEPESAAALAISVFEKTTREQYAKFVKVNGTLDPDAKADYEDRIQLGKGMLRYYTKHVAPVADVGLIPRKVEIEFQVPITGPDGEQLWCKCDQCWRRYWNSVQGAEDFNEFQRLMIFSDDTLSGRIHTFQCHWQGLPVTYGGRIDCLMEDQLGRYWIFDWKTAARLSGEDPGSDEDHMRLDDQITSYCWALWILGIPIAGFVYAEIKKAVPVEPEPNKHIRLGRRYSVSKQLDTTYDLYLNTVRENDTAAYDEGLYDEFLDYLKEDGPKFVKRHQILRNDHELSEAGYNIWQEAKEMTDQNIGIYPSPGRFACKFCAFVEPCLGKNRGEDYEYSLATLYEKRTKHYWETAEPTTDKRMEPAT